MLGYKWADIISLYIYGAKFIVRQIHLAEFTIFLRRIHRSRRAECAFAPNSPEFEIMSVLTHLRSDSH